MTLITVTNAPQRPDGSPWKSGPCVVGIVGAGFRAGGVQIIDHKKFLTDAATGIGSISLEPSNDGEYYVWTNPDGEQFKFVVPATGGPYTLDSVKVDSPPVQPVAMSPDAFLAALAALDGIYVSPLAAQSFATSQQRLARKNIDAASTTDTGVPTFYDDFSGAADGPIAGRVSPTGQTWLAESGQVTGYIVGNKLRGDPGDTTHSSMYPTIDLGFAPTWFRMVCDYDFINGNDSTMAGGGTIISSATNDLGNNIADPDAILHLQLLYGRYDLGISSFYPQEALHSMAAAFYTKALTATLTTSSTTVVATAGTFDATEQPVPVSGNGIPASTLLTYVDDTHATLSNAATITGKSLLTINTPQRTDGSRTYHSEMIADTESNTVTLHLPDESVVSFKVAPHTEPATVTSGSATVLDGVVTVSDQGKLVVGTGIPANTYVGTVTPLTSFKLTSSRASQVDVLASANGSAVTIGQPLSAYVHRYFIFEGNRGDANAPIVRFDKVAIYTRNDTAQPGLWARVGKLLGGDIHAQKNSFYQAKIGRVATRTSSGLLPGLSLGPSLDAYLYRLGANRLGTDGVIQATSFAGAPTTGDTSRSLDPDLDGFVVCNGSSVTLTLPLSGLCVPGKMYLIKNLNAAALTIACSGSEKFDGTLSSISVPGGESLLIVSNGNNSWWPSGRYTPAVTARVDGTPTLLAGTNAGDRTDTVVVTSGSAVVTDTSCVATDTGRPVSGTGIPATTYVGTVIAGTSFRLSSSPTSQVDVLATTGGTSAVIGGGAAPQPTFVSGLNKDSAMTINWGTATAPVATGEMVRVTFGTPFATTPKGLIITQAHPSNSPGQQSYVHPGGAVAGGQLALSTTGFSLFASAPGASKAVGTYRTFISVVT